MKPTTLPDVRRPIGLPEGPALARRVGDAALSLTWRLVQPQVRGIFAAGRNVEPLRRLHYTADDGWSSDLFVLPAAQTGGGQPVLLAHGLGGGHRDFALEPASSLAHALAAAGFAVFLLEHRGDRSATPPTDAQPFSVDDIATRDVPAALDLICAATGFDRVLWVGHALGAQLHLVHEALAADGRIGAVVNIAGAVRFDSPASSLRAAGAVAALLPPNWVFPGRRAQQIASPFVSSGEPLASPRTGGEQARGRLRYAAGDLHGGVVRQLARWVATGSITDATGRLDVVAALPWRPTLVVIPDADPICPPGALDPLIHAMAAETLALRGGWGHLDPLLATDAPAEVFAPVIEFLSRHRETCEN